MSFSQHQKWSASPKVNAKQCDNIHQNYILTLPGEKGCGRSVPRVQFHHE